MLTFLGEKCKIVTFRHLIFAEIQTTVYSLYAVNKKNFSFKFLRTVAF